MSVRNNKLLILSRPDNIIQTYSKYPSGKKPSLQIENSFPRKKLTLDFTSDNSTAVHLAFTPHEIGRMFNTRNYVNHTTGEGIPKEHKRSPTPPEGPSSKAKATPRKTQFGELGEKIGVSPKGRRQAMLIKGKSRNIEDLNATYSIGKAEHRKSPASFMGRNILKNENSSTNLQKRIKQLETYAELLKEKIVELEQDLDQEKDCNIILYYRGNPK